MSRSLEATHIVKLQTKPEPASTQSVAAFRQSLHMGIAKLGLDVKFVDTINASTFEYHVREEDEQPFQELLTTMGGTLSSLQDTFHMATFESRRMDNIHPPKTHRHDPNLDEEGRVHIDKLE